MDIEYISIAIQGGLWPKRLMDLEMLDKRALRKSAFGWQRVSANQRTSGAEALLFIVGDAAFDTC